MPVRLRAAAATDVGSVREVNQDSYLEAPEQGLYAVADGMGGHAAGEIASREAVAALQQVFGGPAASATTLADAIVRANRIVFDQAASRPDWAGMGCTLTAVALLDEGHAAEVGVPSTLAIANVGDSRTYLLRDGGLTQVTDDHSWVQEMVRAGELTAEQAEHHPRRSTLTRALGIADTVEVDLQTVDPVAGDRYVLCSDGLWDELPEDAIASVLTRNADAQAAATELVRLANDAGGRDNITVLIVDVVEDDGREAALAASAALADERRSPATTVLPLGDAPVEPGPAEPISADPADGDPADGDPADGEKGRWRVERAPHERIEQPPLVTKRVVLFVVALLAVVLGAFLAIRATAAQGWWVYLDAGTVTITNGRPPGKGAFPAEGGLLTADKLALADREQLERGPRRYETRAEAEAAVFDDLVCDAIAAGTFTVPAGTGRTCTAAPVTSTSFSLTTSSTAVPVTDDPAVTTPPGGPNDVATPETTAPVGP